MFVDMQIGSPNSDESATERTVLRISLVIIMRQRMQPIGMSTEAPNFYSILGVEPTCGPAEIRSRYYKLCKLYHPDQNGAFSTESDQWALIQRAYRCLSNPARRKIYDIKYGFVLQTDRSHFEHVDELMALQKRQAEIERVNMMVKYEA